MFMDTHTKAHNYTQTDQSQTHEKEKHMFINRKDWKHKSSFFNQKHEKL